MAMLRRRPEHGQTIAHSDHGSVYTSWLFGHRIRDAGLLGSMGSIGDCFDNSVIESFFGSLQNELLDEHVWPDRPTLARAIFEWIEAWYNPRRTASSPPLSMPACRSGTPKTPPATQTPEQRCATTGPGTRWTVTPPTWCRPSSPLQPDRSRRADNDVGPQRIARYRLSSRPADERRGRAMLFH